MRQRIHTTTGWFDRVRPKLATGAVAVLVCLVGYYVVFAPNGLVAFHQKKMESQRLAEEIQALQQDNARREQEIKALKSSPHAIEKEARERLRYARPGEVVYTLPAAQPSPSPSPKEVRPR
ncbi:MAG TPA: septum formation initiator family protein [Candidatus Angelobacter sp.]|nr:septum formation initiator family protein [Candidatus Angelobacter sp.]